MVTWLHNMLKRTSVVAKSSVLSDHKRQPDLHIREKLVAFFQKLLINLWMVLSRIGNDALGNKCIDPRTDYLSRWCILIRFVYFALRKEVTCIIINRCVSMCLLGGATEEEEEMWQPIITWAVGSVGTWHCCWVHSHLQHSKGRSPLHSGKNYFQNHVFCLKQLKKKDFTLILCLKKLAMYTWLFAKNVTLTTKKHSSSCQ